MFECGVFNISLLFAVVAYTPGKLVLLRVKNIMYCYLTRREFTYRVRMKIFSMRENTLHENASNREDGCF